VRAGLDHRELSRGRARGLTTGAGAAFPFFIAPARACSARQRGEVVSIGRRARGSATATQDEQIDDQDRAAPGSRSGSTRRRPARRSSSRPELEGYVRVRSRDLSRSPTKRSARRRRVDGSTPLTERDAIEETGAVGPAAARRTRPGPSYAPHLGARRGQEPDTRRFAPVVGPMVLRTNN